MNIFYLRKLAFERCLTNLTHLKAVAYHMREGRDAQDVSEQCVFNLIQALRQDLLYLEDSDDLGGEHS